MLISSGFSVVYDAPNSAIDVILIHGGEKSWSKDKPDDTWPVVSLEWITPAIPNARIITFRNEHVSNFPQSSAESVSYAGGQMCAELQETRRHESKERPLIMVACSWGGLAMHEGLLRAFADTIALGKSTFGLIFVGKSHTANLLKQPFAEEQIAVTPSQTSYFKSSLHDSLEGFSESFELLAGVYEENIGMIEVMSMYGYTNLADLLDEALGYTRRPVTQVKIRHRFDSVDMVLDYISSRVFKVVRRTVRALNSQINDDETTTDTNAALACENGSYYDRMIDCLSQPPPVDIQSLYSPLSCVKRRETGNWLLELPEFISWMQNDNNTIFWLSGSMGSGKSVLTSYVVEDLKQRLNRGNDYMIASYFYDARYKLSASTAMVLREMIQKVLPRQNQSSARERLRSILVNLDAGDTKISPSQLRAYFTAIRQTLGAGESMFLILDGLDEIDDSETNLIKELIYLARHQNGSHQIKCFISSRSRWTRDEVSDGGVRINIDHEARAREDLAYFIQNEAENLLEARYYGDTLYRKLSANPEGAFSRAVLALRSLGQASGTNDGRIQSLIDSIPTTLTEMYQWMLLRIPEEDRNNARKLLMLVAYSARPLQISELSALMDLDMQNVMLWSQDKSPYSSTKIAHAEKDIPRLSGGLVTVCKDGTVNFVHLSARDYVKSQSSSPVLSDLSMSEYLANDLLTRICFYYLRPSQLRQFLESPKEYQEQVQFPNGDESLTAYAAQYWSFHYRIAEPQSDCLPGLLHNLIRENLISSCCSSCSMRVSSPGMNTRVCTNAALGIGTQVGSEKLVRMLLETGADPNLTMNSDGWTLLHVAARAGDLNMVELLLQHGAHVNPVTATFERTPLYYAAAGGYSKVMRVLLDAGKALGCDLNAFNDRFKHAPLCTAWNIRGILGYKTNLAPRNDLNTREFFTQMLEHADEFSRRIRIAKERLDTSFDDMPLELRKHLANDARRAHSQKEGNLALLQHAAREALIQQLLESGSDGLWQYNNAWGVEDFSAVEAAESKFQLTIQVLLDVPATHDANAARNWGTALEVAVEKGQEASIRLLLEHEATLPPSIRISVGEPLKERPKLPLQGPNVSGRPPDADVLMPRLTHRSAEEHDICLKQNRLKWFDLGKSKFW